MKPQGFIFHLRHIGPFSAFKLGCLTTALGLTSLFACALLTMLPFEIAGKLDLSTIVAGFAATPIVFIGAALLYGVGPGLFLAYHAVMYNIVARWFGGLEIKLDRMAVEVGPQPQPVRPAPAAPSAPQLPNHLPPQSPLDAHQMMLRDEAAELNRQIKERQRRIADIQNQIPKAPK
jgi:hypothetical protein